MFETIAIAGVGLIGGSFGLALRKAGFTGRLIGISSPDTIRDAIARGAIDESASWAQALANADLIYLAQPISIILETIPLLDHAKPTALITDAGSTKAQIVAAAHRTERKAQFLGGHPMAGKEARGVQAADADLFFGRNYFLTPEFEADLETDAAREFRRWLVALGCQLQIAEPARHDRIVACTSHLSQLASTALACAISGHLAPADAQKGAGPGLLDMTRLAASSYDLWADILQTNSKEINSCLDAYIIELTKIRDLPANQLKNQFEVASNLSKSLRKR